MSQTHSQKNSNRASQTASRKHVDRAMLTTAAKKANNRTAPGRIKNPVTRTDSALATSPPIPTYIKETVTSNPERSHFTLS